MVDLVYKSDLPRLKKVLETIREEFSRLDLNTDWTKLRVDPLLGHIDSLERSLRSPEFAQEFSRLRTGVKMFHSDLVYLRQNVAELRKILESERKRRNRVGR